MNRQVVIDTNCLVQMISVHSPYRPAWQAFREGGGSTLAMRRVERHGVNGRASRLPQELHNRFHLSSREDLCVGLVAHGRHGIP